MARMLSTLISSSFRSASDFEEEDGRPFAPNGLLQGHIDEEDGASSKNLSVRRVNSSPSPGQQDMKKKEKSQDDYDEELEGKKKSKEEEEEEEEEEEGGLDDPPATPVWKAIISSSPPSSFVSMLQASLVSKMEPQGMYTFGQLFAKFKEDEEAEQREAPPEDVFRANVECLVKKNLLGSKVLFGSASKNKVTCYWRIRQATDAPLVVVPAPPPPQHHPATPTTTVSSSFPHPHHRLGTASHHVQSSTTTPVRGTRAQFHPPGSASRTSSPSSSSSLNLTSSPSPSPSQSSLLGKKAKALHANSPSTHNNTRNNAELAPMKEEGSVANGKTSLARDDDMLSLTPTNTSSSQEQASKKRKVMTLLEDEEEQGENDGEIPGAGRGQRGKEKGDDNEEEEEGAEDAIQNHQQCSPLQAVAAKLEEDALRNQLLREKAELNKEIQEKTERVRKLKLVQLYRHKNNLVELESLTDKWRLVCQEVLAELLSKTQTSMPTTMQQLVDYFQIPYAMLNFDPDTQGFL